MLSVADPFVPLNIRIKSGYPAATSTSSILPWWFPAGHRLNASVTSSIHRHEPSRRLDDRLSPLSAEHGSRIFPPRIINRLANLELQAKDGPFGRRTMPCDEATGDLRSADRTDAHEGVDLWRGSASRCSRGLIGSILVAVVRLRVLSTNHISRAVPQGSVSLASSSPSASYTQRIANDPTNSSSHPLQSGQRSESGHLVPESILLLLGWDFHCFEEALGAEDVAARSGDYVREGRAEADGASVLAQEWMCYWRRLGPRWGDLDFA